jgi:hypothetical protein
VKRRQFITLIGGVAVAWPFAADAQQSKKIPRLCFLTFDPGTLETTRFKPFFQALRDLGYVDGHTITIDYLSANGQGERFPNLAADCVRLKADVIVVTTTPAAKAAKAATGSIPIVMYPLGDLQVLPATADKVQITEALGKLRAAKLLVGMRGAPPADLTAAAEVVLAISGLMQSIPEISEIDINPLMVHGEGEGATALDALIVVE